MEIKFKDPYIKPNIIKPNPYCDISLAPKRASKPRLWYAVAWKNAINLYGFITGLPKHLAGVFFSDEIFELKKQLAEAKEKIEHDRIGKKWLCEKFNEHVDKIKELEDEVEHLNRSNGQLLHLRRKLGSQVKEFLKSKGLNGGNRG